ncbi:MAG: hypothetical protein DRO99_03110, partial [Candidatus Aenigmatarchaeota archaeon]
MMPMRACMTLIVISFTVLLAPSAIAANCGGSTPCNCGDSVIEDYVMTSDLGPCPGTGLIMNADGVTLDCAGHSITTDGSGWLSQGVDSIGNDAITVKNCVIDGFTNSIRVWYTTNSLFRNNTLTGSQYDGIWFYSGCDNNVIEGNNLSHTGNGIWIEINSDNNTIRDNVIEDCVNGYGGCINFLGVEHNRVIGNRIRDPASSFVWLMNYWYMTGPGSNHNMFRDNVFVGSGSSEDVVVEGTSVNNTFINVTMASESVASGSELFRGWYVDVMVDNGTDPVQGATVDMDNEDWSSSETTGLDGYASRKCVTSYAYYGGTVADKAFQASASKPGHISDSWGPAQVTDNMVIGDGSAVVLSLSCTPTNDCTGLECGHVDDGCGTMLDCGSCGQSEACVSNACQP